MDKYLVTALYHFVNIDQFKSFQQPILDFCKANDIKGTLLLAKEGINGTIAGLSEAIIKFHHFIKHDPLFLGAFENIDHKNEEADQLFNQDIEEEDFEIPAFLRKQKF